MLQPTIRRVSGACPVLESVISDGCIEGAVVVLLAAGIVAADSSHLVRKGAEVIVVIDAVADALEAVCSAEYLLC